MSAARLPLEIFAHICDIIPPMDLCSAILVNKACRQVVERSLYSFIYLDFFDAGQRLRSTRCLQTLSTSTSAAAAVRHLELRGLGLLEPLTQAVFIAAMTLTVNLSSLDLLCIISNNSVVFPEALTRASSFLPRLEALNVDDSELILLLAPGRPCTSVRIQETIQEDSLGDIVDALSRAAVPIQHLQLKVATSGEHGILASFLPIPHSFRSLISVGIQFVLPSPSLTWELFVVSNYQTGLYRIDVGLRICFAPWQHRYHQLTLFGPSVWLPYQTP